MERSEVEKVLSTNLILRPHLLGENISWKILRTFETEKKHPGFGLCGDVSAGWWKNRNYFSFSKLKCLIIRIVTLLIGRFQ